jgi:hypothetical protein
MVTPQEAKAMRDALRAAMVTAKEALNKWGISQQHDMLLPLRFSHKEWVSGRLSIYIDTAESALLHIVWTLDRLEKEAAEEVQAC